MPNYCVLEELLANVIVACIAPHEKSLIPQVNISIKIKVCIRAYSR
jgi:hypothetical protein